jgi:Glutaminase
MKKFKSLLILYVMFSICSVRAEEILTTVFNVIESKKSETILILSGADGKVYKYPSSESNLKYIKRFLGTVVKLNYFKSRGSNIMTQIRRVERSEVNPNDFDLNHFQYNQLRKFAPSDVQSYENVNTIFTNLLNDGDKSRSQCFKRAHMWAYDMWSELGLSTQKIFIFYTQRYIQLEDFEWWFHVAPMVVANNTEYVLDGTFMSNPISVSDWQHSFIKSENITCPLIENYKTYEEGQFKRLCYLMKVPMYYFSPLDIENRDLKGIEKNHWELEELQDARRAFKNYDETYEALDTGKPTITH